MLVSKASLAIQFKVNNRIVDSSNPCIGTNALFVGLYGARLF